MRPKGRDQRVDTHARFTVHVIPVLEICAGALATVHIFQFQWFTYSACHRMVYMNCDMCLLADHVTQVLRKCEFNELEDARICESPVTPFRDRFRFSETVIAHGFLCSTPLCSALHSCTLRSANSCAASVAHLLRRLLTLARESCEMYSKEVVVGV